MMVVDVVEILKALANGVDPTSGAPLTSECACHQPRVVRALFNAVLLLTDDRLQTPEPDESVTHPASGQPPSAVSPDTSEPIHKARTIVTPPPPPAADIKPIVPKPPAGQTTVEPVVQRVAAPVALRKVTVERCPARCGNCGASLNSWGEWLDDYKCVYCQSGSGRRVYHLDPSPWQEKVIREGEDSSPSGS